MTDDVTSRTLLTAIDALEHHERLAAGTVTRLDLDAERYPLLYSRDDFDSPRRKAHEDLAEIRDALAEMRQLRDGRAVEVQA